MNTSQLNVKVLSASEALQEWDRFVDDSPQGCIFCRSWWLDTVCEGRFKIVTIQKEGKIFAGIPIHIRRKGIWDIMTIPKLTQTLGVLLSVQSSKHYEARLSKEMSLISSLVKAIPKSDVCYMNMHFSFTNWLPFYWAGYSQTTLYTYVIEDTSNLEGVFKNIAPRIRRQINKAKREGIHVEDSEDIETFLKLNKMTFSRQGKKPGYSDTLVRKLDAACARHKARKILIARDISGRIHSALYVVYDKKCMYYLMSGANPELRSSGSNALATWKSIEMAHEMKLTYDFEGSMLENVERYFRAFGAVQKPYFKISKYNSITAKLTMRIREILLK